MMAQYDKTVPSAYDALYRKAADTHGVSYDLLRKLSFNESSFNPKAQSPTGPRGIMQFTRATAKGLGLNATDGDDDDRLNPERAIDAGARHLSDLVRKYGGDELKAALAYNQGEGRTGGAQIQAYDKGDFTSISSEGVNYMKKLLDVAQSPRKGDIESFVPKANGVSASEAFAGIGQKPSVSTASEDLPTPQGISIKGKEQEAPNEPFGKSYWEAHGETLEDAESRSTFFGFKNAAEAAVSTSTMGVAFRASREDKGFDMVLDAMKPKAWNSHEFTPEEIEQIRREVKDPRYINAVLGADSETLPGLIKLANENYEADLKASDAGLGAKLSAGVIGAAFDPTTYIPIAGQAAKGFKLVNKAMSIGAQSAAAGVVGEALRTSVAGGDADYQGAALGGFVFGAGMSALADGVGKALGRGAPKNDYAATMIRMEARETARNTDGADLSRLPPENFDFPEDALHVPHPTEEGAAILRDGSILSDGNPLNPESAAPVRALAGSERLLRSFAEIGQTILRSPDDAVRSIGSDLVRPATMMADGSNGKFGATASDIHERLHFGDQKTYRDFYDAMKVAMDDPQHSVGMFKTNAAGVRQEISAKVIREIERPGTEKLTDAERKVMDIVKDNFDRKREMMENPGQFGDSRATNFFPESRHKGTYVPHVYDRAAKLMHTERFGGPEGLQQAISKSWMASYLGRPEVKARVDESLTEELGRAPTMADVENYANKKAYGISHEDNFTSSSLIDDATTQNSITGIENNSFLEARNLFDSDVKIVGPDGADFSVNDLRNFDLRDLMPAYNRRVNGDIAIMGGSGKTTAELKDEILALDKKAEKNGKLQRDVNALKDTVKILTGRGRRDPDSAMETLTRSMTDMGFVAKNAYMGLQNLGEIASMIGKGNVRALTNGVPVLRDLMNHNRALKANEVQELHSFIFGREMDDLIRPSRQDIVQRLRESSNTSPGSAKIAGSIKWATGELAARSPFTKFLNATTNVITDAGRQGVLGDIAHAALKGDGKTKWGKDNFLNSAAVSKEQYEGMLQLFRDHATVKEDGSFVINNKRAFAADPRSMDLYRLADKVADETILRPHKVSSQDTKAVSAGIKMVMQFKNFTLRSLNGRFMRDVYNLVGPGDRRVDAAMNMILSTGLAGALYVIQARLKTMGLPEEQQKDYLQNSLRPGVVAYAAFSRSTSLGAPLSVFNMVAAPAGFDMAKQVRTSILPKPDAAQYDNNKIYKGGVTRSDAFQKFATGALEQVPAVGFAANLGYAGYSLSQAAMSSGYRQQDHTTAAFTAMKELVPNDPLTQQMLYQIFRQEGVDLKSTPRAN